MLAHSLCAFRIVSFKIALASCSEIFIAWADNIKDLKANLDKRSSGKYYGSAMISICLAYSFMFAIIKGQLLIAYVQFDDIETPQIKNRLQITGG